MKLKSKLIGLSVAALVFSGFCSSIITVEAMPVSKFSGSRKVKGINLNSFATPEKNLKKCKAFYLANGLQNCVDKPFFCVAVHGGQLCVYWSPTFLKKIYPKVADLKNIVLEIVDSKGRVYKIKDSFREACNDSCCVMVFAKPVGFLRQGSYTMDEGFRFAVGENYKINLFDLKGDLIVSDLCTSVDSVKRRNDEPVLFNFAHPSEFDEAYFLEKLQKRALKRRENLKKLDEVLTRECMRHFEDEECVEREGSPEKDVNNKNRNSKVRRYEDFEDDVEGYEDDVEDIV